MDIGLPLTEEVKEEEKEEVVIFLVLLGFFPLVVASGVLVCPAMPGLSISFVVSVL